MKHTLRTTGEAYSHKDGITPVYTYDGWYGYDVQEGDIVIINDGPTSSMYILKGERKCHECPISTANDHLCALCVRCKELGSLKAVCRAQFGVHRIDEILEGL